MGVAGDAKSRPLVEKVVVIMSAGRLCPALKILSEASWEIYFSKS